MSLVDSIKRDAKKSGGNKAKFVYFREGTKLRLRFLQDMDEGMELTFHDSFDQGINCLCQEHLGKDCPYCGDDSVRTRSQYVWSVWNYETSEVQLFMFPVNNCSPIPSLMAMYENYGTICDRDYVVSCNGKGTNKTFSVVPMDKNKFRNAKAKPFSESQILKLCDKAWPCEAGDDDDDDEDDVLPKKRPGKAKKPAKSKKPKDEDYEDDDEDIEDVEDDDEDWGDEEEDDTLDYEEMSPKELFKLCKDRGIDVQPKKPARYYIKNLEDYDKQQDDWGDDEDEDDWEDE